MSIPLVPDSKVSAVAPEQLLLLFLLLRSSFVFSSFSILTKLSSIFGSIFSGYCRTSIPKMSFLGRSFPETTTNRLDGEDEQKDVRVEESRGGERKDDRREQRGDRYIPVTLTFPRTRGWQNW